MPSISALTTNVSDNARPSPVSAPTSSLPSSSAAAPYLGSIPPHSGSHSSLTSGSAYASAATEPSVRYRDSVAKAGDGASDGPSRSGTASSNDANDVHHGTNISTTPIPAKKDRAKFPSKGPVTAAVAVAKDDTDSRDDTSNKYQRANGRSTPALGSAPAPASPSHVSTTVDPLSHHIFKRTNTERSIASRLLLNSNRPESPGTESAPHLNAEIPNKLSIPQPDSTKDKKKGVSFLSRLSMRGGKKKDDDAPDDESELGEQRTEGANAVAFSSAAYIPLHKEPPRYIRVRTQHKRVKEFNRIFLAQELQGTKQASSSSEKVRATATSTSDEPLGGPIWAVGFSQDGRFLATGGRDRILRVWAVISTEEDRKAYGEEEEANGEKAERLSAPVFHSKAAREFVGHEGDILALSWSKNNFLLSSSMDKTVRLWHMSRQECLCTFKHKDFVTSIAFHPTDDRFFLAGSLDSSLRLWSIPDKAVAFSSQLSDIITAVAFSPDGKTAIAGCLNGFCMFYETEGLKHLYQLHVRSSRGKNAKGSKITGIQAMELTGKAAGEVDLLITSNDSRIRVYSLSDRGLKAKFRGHTNACNQIRASFSDDGNFVICGSEDGRTFIWANEPSDAETREERPCEYFEAHSEIVTAAIFAPTKTRQLLQASLDPVFTLCNPPPITLRSKEESTLNLTLSGCEAQSEYSGRVLNKPEESPAFIARSAHSDGNIIVTTDRSGLIKVFRQDCAYTKRRHETWESGSTFSRKLRREGMFGRAGSIMTRTSMGSRDPHSRRGSLQSSQPFQPLQNSTDRIDSWRQEIEGVAGRPLSVPVSTTPTTPARSERSLSPHKASRAPISPGRTHLEPETQIRKPYEVTSPPLQPTSPTVSVQSTRTSENTRADTSVPPTPGFSFRSFEEDVDDMRIDSAGASYSFWNLNRWRSMGQPRNGNATLSKDGHLLKPGEPVHRRKNSSSDATEEEGREHRLSSERRKSYNVNRLWSHPLEEGEENDAGLLSPPDRTLRAGSVISALSSELTGSEEAEEKECVKCGSHDFRAKRVGGKQRLLCGRCGRMVDE
ncbi:WD40 repeat-like protein [Poronia punctata]|nr:WD40 repeat-like protein [Poronia punctata]